MKGYRIYLGLSLMSVGAAAVLACAHAGYDVLGLSVVVITAASFVPILFDACVERRPKVLERLGVYVGLSLALSLTVVLSIGSLFSASIRAAGVGILAMLPIGGRSGHASWREGALAHA